MESEFLSMEEMRAWRDCQSPFYADLRFLWFALRTGFEARHIGGADDRAEEDYPFSQVVHRAKKKASSEEPAFV
jgi:hypothetical protein